MQWLVKLVTCCAIGMLVLGAGRARAEEILPHLDRIKVHLAKGGTGTIEFHCTLYSDSPDAFSKDDFDVNDYDALAKYGVQDSKIETKRINEQQLQVVMRGKFKDILQCMRVMDSSDPMLLYRDHVYEFKWDGNVLDLRWEYKGPPAEKAATAASADPVAEITTDGRFAKESIGEITNGGTRIVVPSAAVVRLKIEGLGVR